MREHRTWKNAGIELLVTEHGAVLKRACPVSWIAVVLYCLLPPLLMYVEQLWYPVPQALHALAFGGSALVLLLALLGGLWHARRPALLEVDGRNQEVRLPFLGASFARGSVDRLDARYGFPAGRRDRLTAELALVRGAGADGQNRVVLFRRQMRAGSLDASPWPGMLAALKSAFERCGLPMTIQFRSQ